MTQRERYVRTMTFSQPDRVPNHELGLWGQAHERWLGEGMPEHAIRCGWFEGIEYFGMDQREFLDVNRLEHRLLRSGEGEKLVDSRGYTIAFLDDPLDLFLLLG